MAGRKGQEYLFINASEKSNQFARNIRKINCL